MFVNKIEFILEYVVPEPKKKPAPATDQQSKPSEDNQPATTTEGDEPPVNERPEKVYKITETIQLELAHKCLMMPVLEKKLIGSTILVQKIIQVRTRQLSLEKSKNGEA